MEDTDEIKIQRIIKYFKDKQGTIIERLDNSNIIKFPWIQWQSNPLTVKVLFFNGLPKSVKCSVDELAGVDAVMFVMDKFVWHDTCIVKKQELEKHVAENVIYFDIAELPASSYILFDLAKAYAIKV